jgi:hypothetical protein
VVDSSANVNAWQLKRRSLSFIEESFAVALIQNYPIASTSQNTPMFATETNYPALSVQSSNYLSGRRQGKISNGLPMYKIKLGKSDYGFIPVLNCPSWRLNARFRYSLPSKIIIIFVMVRDREQT